MAKQSPWTESLPLFVHHSTFRLPSLQGSRCRQPLLFFHMVTLKTWTVDMVQSVWLDLYRVCSLTFRMCVMPFAFVFEWTSQNSWVPPPQLLDLAWLVGSSFPSCSFYRTQAVCEVRSDRRNTSFRLSPWLGVLWKGTDVSRTPLRCFKMLFEIVSCWMLILHSSCTGISLRASWLLPFICVFSFFSRTHQ